MSIAALVSVMQAHMAAGGSPFDCPSLRAPAHLKRDLQRAINDIFIKEFAKYEGNDKHEVTT